LQNADGFAVLANAISIHQSQAGKCSADWLSNGLHYVTNINIQCKRLRRGHTWLLIC